MRCFAKFARFAALSAGLLGSSLPVAARDFIDADGHMLKLPPLIEHTLGGYDNHAGLLPPIEERIPLAPLVVDPTESGREFGVHGGTWRMLIEKPKRVRLGVVYGYARLVVYGADYSLQPDILWSFDVIEGRKFVLRLRPGHRWSDGHPFTSEDFRYWWEDVIGHEDLTPGGVPGFLLVDGQPPRVSFPDETTVIYEWDAPNPQFLPKLAGAAPPFIYRPAHYMKRFHIKYADAEELAAMAEEAGKRGWAPLHNARDNMYKSDNPYLPTLQPWRIAKEVEGGLFIWLRNSFFHRIDARGRQLPYIDRLQMSVASSGLIATKTAAGEADLQARGLAFPDMASLKKDEERGGYDARLWRSGVSSQMALYPNLNFADPVWREVLRDVRFRRALSLAINRALINKVIYFNLALPVGNGPLPQSPLYKPELTERWAEYDIARANALLDEMGLTKRAPNGLRLLPDGRPMEVIVEYAGVPAEAGDVLELIVEDWAKIGIRLIYRPIDRESLRTRVASGAAMMAVWSGWPSGLAAPSDPPDLLAPTSEDALQWPQWAQHYVSGGKMGEKPDLPHAQRLLVLAEEWRRTTDPAKRFAICVEMMEIHSGELYLIGIASGAPQPVVISRRLRNVPKEALWVWDPGSRFGVYRPDLFFFAPDETATAAAAAED